MSHALGPSRANRDDSREVPRKTKRDTAGPPAQRTISLSVSSLRLFFTLLSFAIDICFAIYRHTYRIYLHKLCNTDEPTLPRVGPRTSLLRASHPPFFRPHAHRNGARVVRGASRSHERGFSDHPVRSTHVTPFSPFSPSLSLRIARSLVSVSSCPLLPTSVPYTKNLFTLFSPSLRAPLPAISLSVDYGDFLVFLPFCVFIFFFCNRRRLLV